MFRTLLEALLGGRRSGSLALSIAVLGVTAALGWQNGLGRFDQTFYDHIVASHPRPPRADIVIVAIDEPSLARIGRWPWSRAIHADLVSRIAADGPRAIGLDFTLVVPDTKRPAEDAQLAAAVRKAGNVVLPVMLEDGPGMHVAPILPVPEIAAGAAGIGSIHLEVDSDGMVRNVYLVGEIEGRRWHHFAVELVKAGGNRDIDAALPGLRIETPPATADDGDRGDPGWHRDYWTHIPYVGPPGSFPRISYHQILEGKVPPGAFRDKYVLVGMTAVGMGANFSTPVSTGSRVMPGVEIIANILDGLLRGIHIDRVVPWQSAVFSLAPTAILLLGLIWLPPRWALLLMAFLLIGALGMSYTMIMIGGVWYPPGAAIIGLLLAYPLWSWRRLEIAIAYLGEEFERLSKESKLLPDMLRMSGGDVLDRRIRAMTHAAQYLRDLRRFITDCLEGLPDATLVADVGGNVVLANHMAAHHFEVGTAEALLGRRLEDLLATIRPIGNKSIFSLGNPVPPGLQTEGIEARDAKQRDLLVKCVPCFNTADLPIGWIISVIDISSVRQAERKRDETLRFLSHDMRAPQASILALLDLYRDNPGVMSQDELFDRISRSARKTLGLADDFVQLARAESRQYEMEEADLGQLLLDAADECWAPAQARGMRIVTTIPDDPASAIVDRTLCTRAIFNLLGNAIKYAYPDTVIDCGVAADAGGWRIWVRDQGPGIEAADQPYVFQRYRRFHTQSQPHADGVGLGLVFVKTVIQHHGGSVDFSSTPGEGTEFRLYLPAAPEAAADDARRQQFASSRDA